MSQQLFLLLIIISIIIFFILVNMSLFNPKTKLLLSSLFLLEGLSILFLASWTPFYFGFFIIILALFTLNKIREKHNLYDYSDRQVSSLIIRLITNNGHNTNHFKSIGFAIILFELLIAPFFFSWKLGQNDIFFTIIGLVWIFYNYISPDFSKLRDFIFIFLNFVFLILVVPTIIFHYFVIDSLNISAWEYFFIEPLLVYPLHNALNFIGLESFPEGINIRYRDVNGVRIDVSIQQACSGIHSFIIFISAFFAYIDVEVNVINRKIILLLLIFGILVAYLSNLFRMLMIIMIGYYWGVDSLLWAHTNAGWIFFVLWISIFWNLLFRFFNFDKQISHN